MSLTDVIIRRAVAPDKPTKLFDGHGLFLFVRPTGTKWWRMKYRFAGREKQLSLGVYPDVSLTEARKRRDEFRTLLGQGIDPSEQVKAERAAKRDEEGRRLAATRFVLDNDGALLVRLGRRRFSLTTEETGELRAFLDATRAVKPRVKPCP